METKEKILKLTEDGPLFEWVNRIADLIQVADILPKGGSIFGLANVNWFQSPTGVVGDIFMIACHSGKVVKLDNFLDGLLEAKKATVGLPHPPGAGPEYGGFADFEKGSVGCCFSSTSAADDFGGRGE